MEYITNLRQRAQKRNWFKFRLLGNGLFPEVVTQKEKDIIVKINLLQKELIDNFDIESRKLGFAVPNKRCYASRCKCKVIDTVPFKHLGVLGAGGLNVCKKHKKELEEIDGN